MSTKHFESTIKYLQRTSKKQKNIRRTILFTLRGNRAFVFIFEFVNCLLNQTINQRRLPTGCFKTSLFISWKINFILLQEVHCSVKDQTDYTCSMEFTVGEGVERLKRSPQFTLAPHTLLTGFMMLYDLEQFIIPHCPIGLTYVKRNHERIFMKVPYFSN